MSVPLITGINDAVVGLTGSYYLMGILIMVFFMIAFLIMGLQFKYAIMFTSPLVLGFVEMGWFPVIVSTFFWLAIAGIGIIMLWTQFSDR